MTAVERLFKDIVVVEVANVLAGPMVGMFFAELGATVIKVENPTTQGDTTRQWKLPTENGESTVSAYFSCANWGKQSIGINFSNSEGRGILLDLVRRADVFLQSFKPGDERKFQLDYPTLKAINSRLIYAHITAYGTDDTRTGFDAILQAESGFTSINGDPDGPPTKMPVALIDLLLAHQLKQALLLALIERLQTGIGSYVTVSLLQCGLTALANQATNLLVAGTIPRRAGSEHPNIAPYGTVFHTADKQDIVLAIGTDPQFQALCTALDLPDAAHDVRFCDNQRRVVNRDSLNSLLAEQINQFRREDLLERLKRRRVPAGAVLAMDEVFEQPQAQALLIDGLQADGSPIRGVRTVAFQTDAINTRKPLTPPPPFNSDGTTLMQGLLGYSSEQIDALRKSGAIV